jgi:hypothetical protein
VILPFCVPALYTIDAIDPLFRRGDRALTRPVRRAVDWLPPAG